MILGCSTTKYYKVSDLQLELQKNAEQLRYIELSVNSDFQRKLSLYEKLSPRISKKPFIAHELNWRIKEMESKKTSLMKIGHRIKAANLALIQGIEGKEKISDREPIFEKIEAFGEGAAKEARTLFVAFDAYRSSSASFTKIMLFSRESLQGSSAKNL